MERGKYKETYKGREIELFRANLGGDFRATVDGVFIFDAESLGNKRQATFQARAYVDRRATANN